MENNRELTASTEIFVCMHSYIIQPLATIQDFFSFVPVLPPTYHSSPPPITPHTIIPYREVLEQVEDDYRMIKLDNYFNAFFNIMLYTWNRQPEKCLTFEHFWDYYNILCQQQRVLTESLWQGNVSGGTVTIC